MATVEAVAGADPDPRVRDLCARLLGRSAPSSPFPDPSGPAAQPAPQPQSAAVVQPQPTAAPALDPATVRAQYREMQRASGRRLRVAGWVLLPIGYLFAIGAGAMADDGGVGNGVWTCTIPVLGPLVSLYWFIDYAGRGEGNEVPAIMLPIVSLGMQAAGLALLIAGYVRRARFRRAQGLALTDASQASLRFLPGGPGAAGITMLF